MGPIMEVALRAGKLMPGWCVLGFDWLTKWPEILKPKTEFSKEKLSCIRHVLNFPLSWFQAQFTMWRQMFRIYEL